MNFPLSLFLALKLSALKSQNRFVALTSRLAVLGIALGVATLIAVLSVMNGFEYEIRHRLIKDFDHLQVYSISEHYPESLYQTLENMPCVTSVEGYAEAYGLIKVGKHYVPMLLRGFDSMGEGINLSPMDASYFEVGKPVQIVMPTDKMKPQRFELPFNAVIQNTTGKKSILLAEVSLENFAKATGRSKLSGLSVVVDDLYATEGIKKHLYENYHGLYQAFDWKDAYEPLFTALRLQRVAMLFILSMITVVAMFSLVSGLIMLSSDRLKEIALLRAMGLSRTKVSGIFLIQGVLIGVMGLILGIMLGLLLCHFAGDIAIWLEKATGLSLVDERVYGTSRLIAMVELNMIAWVSLMSLVASVVASIYPAAKIAQYNPSEVLRGG